MPYWDAEIHTPLSIETCTERIRKMVQPRRGPLHKLVRAFEDKPNDPPFHGEVHERSFKVRRVIGYKNSFLPVIEGVLERNASGTTVLVRMRMHVLTILFLVFWVGFLGFMLVTTRQPIAGAMLAAGLVLMAVCFYPEARKAETLLRRALRQEQQPPTTTSGSSGS